MPHSASCDYCGLPVATAASASEPVYCCFGCQFAAGVTRESDGAMDRLSLQGPYARLGISVFCTMNVIMLTMALWAYAENPDTRFAAALADFLRYFAMLFTIPVLVLLGRPLAESATGQLRRGLLSTDLLLLTGVLAASAASILSTFRGNGHVYFEVACVILVLVSLGRWLEAHGRVRASQALDELERLLPDRVLRLEATGDQTEEIPVAEIRAGDRLRVRAGERVAVDATVESGTASVDEQFFTGESVPVLRTVGDEILGGSLNLDGDLVVCARSTAEGGALARLVRQVREARLARGEHQALADRWSRAFFPIIGLLALATFGVHTWRERWDVGLMNALSVVLIACPCGLALATPLAAWAALGTAARRGVLFRSGEAIERLARTRRVYFDKSGTLTTGQPRVVRFVCENPQDFDLLRNLSVAVTQSSTHPFSVAIHEFLEAAGPLPALEGFRTVPGAGLEGVLADGGFVYVGSREWMASHELSVGPRVQAALADSKGASASHVFVGTTGRGTAAAGVGALFLLEETLRPSVTACLAGLEDLAIGSEVLTGDRRERGEALRRELGIPVRARLLPEQKVEWIRRTGGVGGRGTGTDPGVVMVGDGLNDAPALAAASLGMALGCGTDVSRDTADVCLVRDDLAMVPWSIGFARRTVRTMRQNLGWSFGYNGVGVVFAAAGWLHPAIAAALMVVSSLMVLGNSLRLQEGEISPSFPSPLQEGPAGLLRPSEGVEA